MQAQSSIIIQPKIQLRIRSAKDSDPIMQNARMTRAALIFIN